MQYFAKFLRLKFSFFNVSYNPKENLCSSFIVGAVISLCNASNSCNIYEFLIIIKDSLFNNFLVRTNWEMYYSSFSCIFYAPFNYKYIYSL